MISPTTTTVKTQDDDKRTDAQVKKKTHNTATKSEKPASGGVNQCEETGKALTEVSRTASANKAMFSEEAK